MNERIWFRAPAEKWKSALPVGNGHIGCMTLGATDTELLYLNDDTLWSGYIHDDYIKPDFKNNMQQIKSLMVSGKRYEAQELFESKMAGRFSQAYMPLGMLKIQMPAGIATEYTRWLDMTSGTVYAEYKKKGTKIKTKTFVSYPDDVLVHVITFTEPSDIAFSFDSPLIHNTVYETNAICVDGYAPSDILVEDVYKFYTDGNVVSYDDMERSTRFAAKASVVADGRIIRCEDKIDIKAAKKVTIIFSSSTSYGGNVYFIEKSCHRVLYAVAKGAEAVFADHMADHSALFEKLNINLNNDDAAAEDRYRRMKNGDIHPGDIELLYQYGRYLLIGASRKNTQPANLQGIWNMDVIPPWWSNYTLNINMEMNYWLADRANLGECFQPFVEYTKRLCEAGKKTAREAYGLSGSVAHHQTDIWAQTTPVGFDSHRVDNSASWAMWNMSLPWLCIQLFDHYLYTKDKCYLKNDVIPVMKNAAEFMMANFTEYNGKMCNIPSTSPENIYIDADGRKLSLCNMCAMDIGITTEFLRAYMSACAELGEDRMASKCAEFAKKLPNYKISGTGALLEWDDNYEELEKGHRHFSMLFGIFPCSHLLKDEKLRTAGEKALLNRLDSGSAQTGWSAIWAIALLSRLGLFERAEAVVRKLMMDNIHENMFGAHPPDFFQIDANYGFTAAVSEMFVQQYDCETFLLPSLPDLIKDGSITGLKLYGGHELSMKWKDKKLIKAVIKAGSDDVLRVKCGVELNEIVQLKEGGEYRLR